MFINQVKLLQGGANPFAAILGPSDELRVSYVNAFKQQGAGLATTLEVSHARQTWQQPGCVGADRLTARYPVGFNFVPLFMKESVSAS